MSINFLINSLGTLTVRSPGSVYIKQTCNKSQTDKLRQGPQRCQLGEADATTSLLSFRDIERQRSPGNCGFCPGPQVAFHREC